MSSRQRGHGNAPDDASRADGADEVYDRQLAVKLSGGNDRLADDLLAMLAEELPEHQRALHRAVAEQDLATLREHAHKINGGASYCGLSGLQEAAARLERAVQREDFAAMVGCLRLIDREVERIVQIPHETNPAGNPRAG